MLNTLYVYNMYLAVNSNTVVVIAPLFWLKLYDDIETEARHEAAPLLRVLD